MTATFAHALAMELRSVQMDERMITGRVAPYDATSYLAGDVRGERIMRGAFRRSINNRGDRIPLCRAHDHARALGMSRSWADNDDGLVGQFYVRPSALGDEALEEARDGYLTGMSVGFLPVAGGRVRAADGASEVREARLLEVSLVVIPAYDGADVLAVRSAQTIEDLMAPFLNPPAVNLSPMPAPWAYDPSR